MRHYIATIITICTCVILASACVPPPPTRSPISPLARPSSTPYPTRVPIVVVPGNLLIDPSLEGPYRSDGMHPEVNTSYAWRAWYSCQGDQAVCAPPCLPGKLGCNLPCPADCTKSNGACVSDYGCYWSRQEFNPFNFDKAPYRIHSGDMAQVIFSYGRQALGGIMQTVTVDPGTSLKFTAWIQAWQCFDYGVPCDWGRKSDKPSDMHLRIGIDPAGGTDPASANIAWSHEREAYDRYVQFSVTARAQGDSATVFTQGGATFDWARKNNDIYIDDLALVVVNETPTTPTPTSPPPATPTPTITPTFAPPTVTPIPVTPGVTLTCQLSITQRVYVLLPPGSGAEWHEAALPVVAARGWSLGTSAVDACVNSCGQRTVIVVNAQKWGCNLYPACNAPCSGLQYQPVSAETPADLATLLDRYPDWLQEAWGQCLPMVVKQ